MGSGLQAPELPYPNGWFALAYSSELPRRKVLRRRLMGEDVVLYRTTRGTPRAVGAHCPHLGAHLGHGGRSRGRISSAPSTPLPSARTAGAYGPAMASEPPGCH
ncbi:Rieske 2Fe-2S domain-containing protein [Streptomyces roseochromogenus]|uniref:Rieske (2Fe-2S) protein n=1 Tax=Streptomyces roseochromogenus TaxID=285450 RepID=UPI000998ADD7